MKIRNIQFIIRIGGAVLFVAFMLCLTIIDIGFTSYRVVESYPGKINPQISDIFPVARTQIIDNVWQVIDEPVYFTTRMSTMYDSATVRLRYRNECCQSIILGIQVGGGWDYQQEILHNNDFNQLPWDRYDVDGVTLWSKQPMDLELADVLQSFDDSTRLASFNSSVDIIFSIDGYADSRQPISRAVGVIGPYSLLVYIVDELDINLLFSEVMTPFGINVYDVDGNRIFVEEVDNSQYNLNIMNLKEGVYKIVIAASMDIVTRSIESKHKYINFINQLNLASGNYSFVTNATMLRWQVNNWAGRQTVQAGDEAIAMRAIGKKYYHRQLDSVSHLKIPVGNVSVFCDGLIGFDENYLLPYIPGKVSRIDNQSDYDYFIAKYNKPSEDNGWYDGEIEFDLARATISQGKLRFMIGALGADIDYPLLIDNIEVIYQKKADQQSIWSEFIDYLKYWWVYGR